MSNQSKDKLLGGTQGRRLQRKKPSLDWQSALQLDHNRQALVYQRLSTTEQIKNSPYSLAMQDALEDLAISDGYEWTLNSDERLLIRQSGNYSGWYQNGQIIIEQRDLGLSGTLGQEDRAGLEHLINLIEANQIETVYVLHISRLFRDQTLIDAFAFAELCKKHDVKIITPAMRLNLRISMHMDYYRREADWAAKELEVMHGRLYGAKKRKAHQGRWAGGYLPVGYILDERETIEGRSNPDWHKFMPYEPHARVVRLILRRLCLPGMTGGRVARWCAANGIRFEPFPPELAERYTKLVALRHPDTDGGWAVGEQMVNAIASNPVYIGWWIWGDEKVSEHNHPPLIDEETFWCVQENLNSRRRGPNKAHGLSKRQTKKDSAKPRQLRPALEPFPLTGLLFCMCTSQGRKLESHGSQSLREYSCVDWPVRDHTHSIAAANIEDPIADFVLMRCTFPEYAEEVIERLQSEYDQARERAAAIQRELARLDDEIDNLQHNFALIKLTPERAAQLDLEIQARLNRKQELAKLDSYPAGKIAQAINGDDIVFARDMLSDLRRLWPTQNNELKNIFLRLVVDKVEVWGISTGNLVLQAKIYWRSGVQDVVEITVPNRGARYKRWTPQEDEIIRQRYVEGHAAIMPLLPDRNWTGIVMRARKLGIFVKEIHSQDESWRGVETRLSEMRRWTPDEEDIVREWISGKITTEIACQRTGRTSAALRWRANMLGLYASERRATWRLISSSIATENNNDSKWAR